MLWFVKCLISFVLASRSRWKFQNPGSDRVNNMLKPDTYNSSIQATVFVHRREVEDWMGNQ